LASNKITPEYVLECTGFLLKMNWHVFFFTFVDAGYFCVNQI